MENQLREFIYLREVLDRLGTTYKSSIVDIHEILVTGPL